MPLCTTTGWQDLKEAMDAFDNRPREENFDTQRGATNNFQHYTLPSGTHMLPALYGSEKQRLTTPLKSIGGQKCNTEAKLRIWKTLEKLIPTEE